MTDTFRALCAELTAELEFWSDLACKPSDLVFEEAEMLDLIKRARAALAQPEPVGASDEALIAAAKAAVDTYPRVSELPYFLDPAATEYEPMLLALRAAAALGHLAITPIPVSERLPGDGDLDDQGTCWMWNPVNFYYCLCRPDPSVHSHWLPAHALPLPEVEV